MLRDRETLHGFDEGSPVFSTAGARCNARGATQRCGIAEERRVAVAEGFDQAAFTWQRLEKLEAAISWRRDEENLAVANVWHLETVAELADAIRAMIEERELDERLIALLWEHVPGDARVDVTETIEAPGSVYPGGSERLSAIINPILRLAPPSQREPGS